MATWKKVLTSGSAIEVSSLSLDTALTVDSGGTGQSTLSSGEVLLGNGTGAINSVARTTPTADGKIVITGGTNAVLASTSFAAGGGLASGSALNDISDLTPTDSNFIVGNGTTWVAETGATARTSIGLGTADSPTFAGATINGDVSGIGTASADYFVGDGSNLTGLPSAAINTYSTAADNRIITSVDATSVQGEANLTFDGSTLTVTGAATVTGNTTLGDAAGDTLTVNAQTINLANISAGTDDTVVVWNGSSLVTDEIDSRVWGTSLVDGTGAATRLAYWSDSDTLTSNSNITTDGTTLTVNGSTFSDDVVIAGDLTVNGDTFNVNVANISVEDRFALFNSGSATGDGGIIIQTETNFSGAGLGWDDSATRFGTQKNTKLAANATAMATEAYIAAVLDIDGGQSDIAAYQQNGNIKISGGEIYIYS